MKKLSFPSGFLWGAATSAHQVEGGNYNDWSVWEKKNSERLAAKAAVEYSHLSVWPRIRETATDPANYLSGKATEHFIRFREDFDIARQLGHNAHRFSLEWSRIEPEMGRFNHEAIAHYREVLLALRERGLEPFVTLWHWTLPVWLAEKGGVESSEFSDHFERYTRFVVNELKDLVTFWLTLNEPTSVIGMAYTVGQWPPQKKSFLSAVRVYFVMARAHNRAFHAIHQGAPQAQVGFGNLLHSFEPYYRHSPFDHLQIFIARLFTNRFMLWLTRKHHDFLTVQYYFHNRFRFPRKVTPSGMPTTDMGWEIYPKGIYNILDHLKRYRLPIYITENGLADAGDTQRLDFIREHLVWIHRALEEGADVRGYFYWSLLDNFEWDKGFWPRFGLVEVDYKTQERKIRPSAYEYAKICRANTLEIEDEKTPA